MDIRSALKREYRAAFATLRQTIEQCPDDLWLDETPKNPYWRGACHAALFGHLYMMPRHSDFTGFLDVGNEYWDFDAPVTKPLTQAQLLAYLDHIDTLIDDAVDRSDLDSAESGFHWYSIPKLDHQILSIRHVQHHAAQLADRLRQHSGAGIDWRT